MAKAPAFQFYPGDWSRDLEEHPLEIEGAWIRICCKLWWSEKRGELTRTYCQWGKILRVDETDAKRILEYVKTWKIGNVSEDCNGNVTVISRRMQKDEIDRENNNERRMKHYYKSKCNPDVTPTSQDSSSSSSIKEKIYKKEKVEFDGTKFINIPDDLKQKWTSIAPGITVQQEITKAEAWVLSNPKLKKSNWSRFLTNWITRAQDRAVRTGGNGNGAYQRLDKFGKPVPRQKWEDEADRINADYYRRKAQDAPDGKAGKDAG